MAHNDAYARLFGFAPIVGQTLVAHAPALVQAWGPALDSALGGRGAAVDPLPFEIDEAPALRIEHHGVTWLPALDGAGRSVGAIGLLHDATPVVERMRRLLGAIAHDLRDPLVAIRLVAQHIGRAVRRESGVSIAMAEAERVVTLTDRMNRLIGQVASFAQLAGGAGMRLERRPGDLGALVRSICDELRAQGAAPLTATAHEMYGLWDPDAIRRLLSNLVNNARRYGPPDGCITVSLERKDESALLEVFDEGMGIRDDEAAKLFEPWQRGARLDAGALTVDDPRREVGSGLGLFIVREIVAAHDGHIRCERLEPRGFVIRVRLPVPSSGVFASP